MELVFIASAFPNDQTLAAIAIGLILIVAIPAGLIVLVLKLWKRGSDRRPERKMSRDHIFP